MKSMRPEKRFAQALYLFVLIALLTSTGLSDQTKKSKAASTKKPAAKKSTAAAKDAKKPAAKNTSKTTAAKKTSAKTADKSSAKKASAKTAAKTVKKETAKSKTAAAKEADDQKRRKGKKKETVAERRARAKREKAEAARRAAALAEQRRREAAARAARARKLAFERGLREETVKNIAHDNTEGEDLTVRRAAVNALGNHAGTVVVMEAQTGKVLTIVNQDWAIRNSFKPCSTIKLVTGVAGVNEDIINSDGSIKNASDKRDLEGALAYSSNTYFQKVGVNMGSSKMIEYAKDLGLGERTGINAEGETAGKLPYGNNNARIYSHGDDFEVTPLQLAVMVSAISNGGKKVVPQVGRARVEKVGFKPVVRDRIDVDQKTVERVIPGMIGAAEYGTARRGVDASMGVAGKTGSCIFKGSWIGLFASVAPVEDPTYSVVVITRGQNERGKYAAAIAGKVYAALNAKMQRRPDRTLARTDPKVKLDEATAEVDEEEDDSDSPEIEKLGDEAPIVVGARPQTVAAQPPPANKKLVQKTGSSKPAFKPVVIEFDRSGAGKKAPKPGERPRVVKN